MEVDGDAGSDAAAGAGGDDGAQADGEDGAGDAAGAVEGRRPAPPRAAAGVEPAAPGGRGDVGAQHNKVNDFRKH